MARDPRQPKASSKQRPAVYYADPAHPGRSRHRECFRQPRINPKRAGYQLTDGPCWVCEHAKSDYTLYVGHVQQTEHLELIATSLEQVSDAGFALAKEVRCRSFLGRMERKIMEAELPAMVSAFRQAWQQAEKQSADPDGTVARIQWPGDDPGARKMQEVAFRAFSTGLLYAVIGIKGSRGVLSPLDPRYYLARGNPTQPSFVDSSAIEQVSGCLGYIARHIRRKVQQRRDELQANRGQDASECLRLLAQLYGASPLRLAETALAFLEPSRQLSDAVQARAETMANNIYQRSHQQKPLPGE